MYFIVALFFLLISSSRCALAPPSTHASVPIHERSVDIRPDAGEVKSAMKQAIKVTLGRGAAPSPAPSGGGPGAVSPPAPSTASRPPLPSPVQVAPLC